MPRGRPRNAVEMIGLKVRIPKRLHLEIALLLADPLRGHIKHGTWQELMTNLLQAWVDEQRKEMTRDRHFSAGD